MDWKSIWVDKTSINASQSTYRELMDINISLLKSYSDILINRYLVNFYILYPLETFGFMVFLGGIRWEHCPKMR